MFENHTVFENLELALAGDRTACAALFFRLGGEQAGRIDAVLETIALSPSRDVLAGSLSHGQNSGWRLACC